MSSDDNDLRMYLTKLVKTIETQSSFNFGNKRIVNKTRIDDILCCIDVNIPQILKRYNKEYNTDKNVRCFRLYNSLIANIKIKPLLGKNSYAVNYSEVLDLVQALKTAFEEDETYVKHAYTKLENYEQ